MTKSIRFLYIKIIALSSPIFHCFSDLQSWVDVDVDGTGRADNCDSTRINNCQLSLISDILSGLLLGSQLSNLLFSV